MTAHCLSPPVVVPERPLGLAPAGRTAGVVPSSFAPMRAGSMLEYTVDFSALLCGGADSEIDGFTITTMPGGNKSLIPSHGSVCGARAKFRLSGGIAGTDYVVTISAATRTGLTLVTDIKILIVAPGGQK